MRNIRVNSFALGFIVLVALIATVVMTPRNAQSQAPAQPPVASFSCNGFAAVRLTSTLPRDLIALAQQQGADCFAWQSFIALNWPALPSGSPDPKAGPSDFGKPPADPLNPQPTVWQTFYDSVTALTPNASRARSYGHMRLRMTSKVGHRSVLNSIGQAFTNGAWLTDQAGGLVFYEILVNPDEFNYIQKNALYSIPGQNACVKGKGGLILPDGAAAHDTLCTGEPYSYGTTGAIEIKSAWIVLDPKNPAQLNRYLIARALVQPPNGPATTQTVGLVGLHIIRKVNSAQQFVWSTFEHVDNDPDLEAVKSTARQYTFFNPKCNPQTDPYQCTPNQMPVPAPTGTATMSPYNAAVQVVRQLSTSPMVNAINSSVWQIMPGNSVFKNYRLIDTIWPTSNQQVAPGSNVPLTDGAPQVDMQPMTNTTMETYFQNPGIYAIPKDGCMDCHVGATIAASTTITSAGGKQIITIPSQKKKATSNLKLGAPASDYSFVFDDVTPAPMAKPRPRQ